MEKADQLKQGFCLLRPLCATWWIMPPQGPSNVPCLGSLCRVHALTYYLAGAAQQITTTIHLRWRIVKYSENRATSQILKVLPNMVFPPDWGGKMAAFWACACKLSWTLFSPARVQPLYRAGRKESSGTGMLGYQSITHHFAANSLNFHLKSAANYVSLTHENRQEKRMCCINRFHV